MTTIEVENIVKDYGAVRALDDISLSIQSGELFGLVGADGSGKSTLMRILASLVTPDKGHATVDGLDTVRDYRALRCRLGYMPGRFSLYGDLTVEENLRFFASVFGTTIERNRTLIDDIYRQIEPFRTRRAARLSGGMKQKLALCCALIHAPRVLLLDEPTTGVDPVSRRELWQMLGRLRKAGITIVATTPYMDEASRCDRMAFVREGHLIGLDSPRAFVEAFGEPLYAAQGEPMHRLLDDLRATAGVVSCHPFGEAHHFTLDTAIDPRSVSEHLSALGYTALTIRTIEPSIEDCYLKLTSR